MNQGFGNQQQGGYDPQGGEYSQQDGYGQQQQQRGIQLPRGQVSRPFVDPQAAGEVDPNQYPAPKESTHKIRGRSDFLDKYFSGMNHELLFAKAFYFFFFSAFGSLFPLMAVYFKQMAMSGAQTGVLIGIRPFVEFLACPFWGSLADKWRKGKIMLVASVSAWIIFTLAVGFVQPPASACVTYNGTHEVLSPAYERRDKRSLDAVEFSDDVIPYEGGGVLKRSKRYSIPFLPPTHIVGKSPVVLTHVANYEQDGKAKDYISPPFSSIVYHQQDVQKVFFLLILLVILGEFFSSPAITLADTAVLNYLGDEADLYGKQRMFGSLGWGLTMFFVGIALDHSTSFPDHPCTPHDRERNYAVCFSIFGVLMGCAMLVSSQFRFDYSDSGESIDMQEVKTEPDYGAPKPWDAPKIPMQQTKSGKEKLEEAVGSLKVNLKESPVTGTKVFAQTVREKPQWMLVLKEFKSMRCGAFLFVAWWMGFGIGLIFAFLFWHLQDYGGSPTLFGIASILNHISEICAYFFSFRLIEQLGHIKVLCVGLAGNVLRFLYVAYMRNPWFVLPFEFIQGITHAAVWAACCSYIAHNTPQHLRHQAQGVLQGIHHGIGRGCGAIIGGFFVNYYGTVGVFFAYGILSLFVLLGFIFINFYRRDGGFQPDLPADIDPHQMADEGAALAPHGVPANPMPRAPSTQNLDKQEDASYGSFTTNGMLDVHGNQQGGGVAGGSNPFTGGGGGGGGGYTNYSKNPAGVESIYPNKEQINLTEQNSWAVQPSGPNSPVDTAVNQEVKNQFKAYNEAVNESFMANKKAFDQSADEGDLGYRNTFLAVR